MKKYLSTLHKRPPHHKKRFALLVSATFTLLIFCIWSLIKFGMPHQVRGSDNPVASVESASALSSAAEISPIQSLLANVSDSWKALKGEIGTAKEGLNNIDIKNQYKEVRNDALPNTTYGE